MGVNSKELAGTPVRTKAGTYLGKVSSVDFDSDSGRLTVLRVKTRGLVPGLMDNELQIAWSQIAEFSQTEVIVEDGVVPRGATVLAVKPSVSGGGANLADRDVA